MKLDDAETKETYNFKHKRMSFVYMEMLVPGHVPAWAKAPVTLARAIDDFETRCDAQLLREVLFSLPRELTQEQNIPLARDVACMFVHDHGMIAMLFVHNAGVGNPYVYILLPMRPLNKDGTWGAKSHQVPILDEQGRKIKLANGNYKSYKINTTDWNNRENVEKWREKWAAITNWHLEKAGYNVRIHPQSYKKRGLEERPTIPIGTAAHHMEKRGIRTERGDYNRQVQEYNQQLLKKRSELLQQLVVVNALRSEQLLPSHMSSCPQS